MVAQRFWGVEFWMSIFCCCFLQASAVSKKSNQIFVIRHLEIVELIKDIWWKIWQFWRVFHHRGRLLLLLLQRVSNRGRRRRGCLSLWRCRRCRCVFTNFCSRRLFCASASSRFPTIFSSQFVNVVVHLLSGEPGILFLAILTHFSCRLEKVANEDFGTEAEVFPLEIFDTVLFQVL